MSMRGKRYPLTPSSNVQALQRHGQSSDYELMSLVEQVVFDHKLGKKAGTTKLPLFQERRAKNNAVKSAPDALVLLTAIAKVLADASDKRDLEVHASRLDLLSKPVCFFEFRRARKEYASFCHLPTGADAMLFRTIIDAMVAQFVNRRTSKETDEEVRNRLSWLMTQNIDEYAKLQASTTLADNRLELDQICTVLCDHIDRNYKNTLAEELLLLSDRPIILNRPNRDRISTWRDRLEAFSCTKEFGGGKVQPDAPNCYPYVAVELVDPFPGHMLVCCVGAIDPWFVDDRVEAEHRLPEITLGIYDISHSPHQSLVDRRSVQEALRARLAGISGRVMAFKRGQALESVAGEASNIGRYWFGQGASALLESKSDDGGLDIEDTTEFWTRFVKDLLCAKIPGIKSTEVFPFDRAFIFRNSPANPGDGGTLKVRVLEAALLSNAAKTRFQFMTSLERSGDGEENKIDIADLDVTSKTIKLTSDLELFRGSETRSLVMSVSTDGTETEAEPRTFSLEGSGTAGSDDTSEPKVETALRALLLHHANDAEDDIALEAARNARIAFDKEGFLYEYRNGLNLAEEVPLVSLLDRNYKASIDSKAAQRQKDQDNSERDSKVVVISYDPTLNQDNRKPGGGHYVLNEEAFTIVLLADDDIEKGVQDIAAESDDLALLFTIILRQKMRDRKREEQIIARRVEVVRALVDSLMHKVATGMSDKAANDAVQSIWKGIRETISFDRGGMLPISGYESGGEYMSTILGLDSTGEHSVLRAEDYLRSLTADYVRQSKQNVPPPAIELRFADLPIPTLSLRLPLRSVKEAFEVVLKNAVEAVIHPRAPRPASITVAVSSHAIDRAGRWALELTVENTTKPLDREVWNKLTSDRPQIQGVNRDKQEATGHSTGVGVYAARQMLQSGLGSVADIRFHMVGANKLQARIILPAQLQKSVVETSPRSETHETDVAALQILYVEDEEGFRSRGLAFLHEQLGPRGATATSNRRDAEAVLAKALPRVLITDLSILATATSDAADPSLGPKLVRSFMKRANEAGTRPPVWIVTGSDLFATKQKFSELNISLSDFKYEWADGFPSAEKMCVAGRITVLEHVKKIADEPLIGAALSALRAAAPEEVQTVATTSAEALRPRAVVQSLVLGQPVGPALIEVRRLTGQGVVVVDAGQVAELEELLLRWFTDPGGIAPQSDDDDVYPPWRATAQRRIVLLLSEPRLRSLSLRARYWLMRHNAVATMLTPQEVADSWLVMKNEASGPVGRIRHDVRNLTFEGMTSAKQAEIDLASKRIDADLLKYPDESTSLLEMFSNNPTAQTAMGAAQALMAADPSSLSADLSTAFQTVESLLASMPAMARHESANAQARVAPLRSSLVMVRKLLLS